MTQTAFVLDFGAQYSQLIARRTRELGVYCEIVPYDTPWSALSARRPAALILSGGPESALVEDAPEMDSAILDSGVPMLGICYGMQLLAREIGAELVKLDHAEYGPATLIVGDRDTPLFDGVPNESRVWMSHGDTVVKLPRGYRALASTERCHVAAMGDPKKKIYATQFHPEVVHTQYGRAVLENFLGEIAALRRDWKVESFLEQSLAAIRQSVGSDKVICALSGGVDSAVAATLVARAIGEQLTCIFVDHGLLRQGEAEEVLAAFREILHLNVVAVDAGQRFLAKLRGIEDPERKRIVIGHEFIDVFEAEAAKIPGVKHLVQGTLYPDVIESKTPQSKAGHKIKSHHNVGGLPEQMGLSLIEPLRALFKDEVRALGRALGLPAAIVERQPFPGPGLAVRIIGDVTQERLEVVRGADAIVRAEIDRAELDPHPWQYFAVLTPVKSVGVMGDGRTYANLVAVRAITSEDGMTADWARLPHELLERISSRIVNEVRGVNRVAYDITTKPPATVEWE
ncbi:MAG: glutamine-hydrolyzing GMP synthase [Candidatus Eremiobacteraeota bacterium]|nr:glutamine-hydrolyzing GMP synthase [Candidatus Eremiobacteraeota bacterium]MBV8499607.1 glutamine-hydrolyzing GMP synthase [Candidatus Eremiobacteraeota bacterium]